MIQVATPGIHQSHQNLLSHACKRKRDLQGFGGRERIAQVLLVQADAESRFELREITMGAFAFNTALPANPPLTALNTTSGSSPALVARTRASP